MPTDEGDGAGFADGSEESRAIPHSPHARHLLPEGEGSLDARPGAWTGVLSKFFVARHFVNPDVTPNWLLLPGEAVGCAD